MALPCLGHEGQKRKKENRPVYCPIHHVFTSQTRRSRKATLSYITHEQGLRDKTGSLMQWLGWDFSSSQSRQTLVIFLWKHLCTWIYQNRQRLSLSTKERQGWNEWFPGYCGFQLSWNIEGTWTSRLFPWSMSSIQYETYHEEWNREAVVDGVAYSLPSGGTKASWDFPSPSSLSGWHWKCFAGHLEINVSLFIT